MMAGIYITGTDTEVGKTVVTGLFARYLLDLKKTVITQKWIQTGCSDFSSDIEEHLKWMGQSRSYVEPYLKNICPYIFKFPASAHLASSMENMTIDPSVIIDSYKTLAAQFEYVIAEGIGGALVPISKKAVVSDIAAQLKLPAVIVAKNKLGAINHTLLTIEALRARGIKISGVVFNGCDQECPESILQDNINIIEEFSGVTVLGQLPWTNDKDKLIAAFKPIGEKILLKVSESEIWTNL